MTCPVHGPGCYGIPEECLWIEADMRRRAYEALELAEQERGYYEEQERLYEVEWEYDNVRGLA